MANLEFCDTYTMLAYLLKTKGSEGFHQIVDFHNSSHIKYALTKNPTIYTSLIQQFWQSAAANTIDTGEVQIVATIDGKVKLVSKASIRRHLKLEDSDGISTLPNTEIFEQLALIGNIAIAIICLATNRTFNFSKMIFEGMLKNLDSKSKFLMYLRLIQIFLNKHKRPLLPHNRTYVAPTLTHKLFSNMRRASKGYFAVDVLLFQTMLVQGLILQGEGSTVPVESHHTPLDAPTTSQPQLLSPSRIPTRQETEVPQPSSPTHTHVADEAASTGVDVRNGEAATTVSSLDTGCGISNIDKTPFMPQDLPLLRVNTLGSDGGSMTLNELTVLCIKLSQKVESLDADLKQTKKVYGAAYTNLIMKVKKLEKLTLKGRIRVKTVNLNQLGVFSATKVLAEVAEVHTYTRRRRTISTAEESVSTAGASMAVSTAGMVDKGKAIMQESEPELTTTKLQQRQERASYEAIVRLQEQLDEEERQRTTKLKKLSFEELKNLFEATMRRVKTFTLIESDFDKTIPKISDESSKRAAEEEFEQESTKRQKTRESSKPREKEDDELKQEDLQQMMMMFPVEEVYVEQKLDRDDLVQLWSSVKERFSTTEPTDDKEKELWVELKRLLEPDVDDTLWKLQRDSACNHCIEPIELKIPEMVNIWVLGEAYC
nr:hypothetical protein [Tanacetum cinerariifolium]